MHAFAEKWEICQEYGFGEYGFIPLSNTGSKQADCTWLQLATAVQEKVLEIKKVLEFRGKELVEKGAAILINAAALTNHPQ